MSIQKKAKTFGCTKCGEPFEIHPPDEMHTIASRDEKGCGISDHVKMEYICKNCKSINNFYWCGRHDDFYHA